jgi:hypothetical protein
MGYGRRYARGPMIQGINARVSQKNPAPMGKGLSLKSSNDIEEYPRAQRE